MASEEIRKAAAESKVVTIWGTPDMTTLDGGRRQPPPLPMECFGAWGQWIVDRAEACSAPPDYVAAGFLATSSGLIGNARWVSPWPGWTEPPVLWLACVGNPSSGKSPALDAVLATLRHIEGQQGDGFSEELRAYERDREAARIRRHDWEGEVKKAVKKGNPPPDMPDGAVEPERPERPRLLVSDTSIEQLARLLSQNSKGLIFYRDELSGWLGNIDKYGAGDRGFWIEAYGGRGYRVDRVKYAHDPILIDYATMAAVGGIQPDRLNTLLMKGDDDGLASRFLMVWPNPTSPKRPHSIPDEGALKEAFARLAGLAMPMDADGKRVPSYVPMADDAAALFQEWREDNAKKEREASGLYLSHLGKLPGMVARLSLVLEYLDWALVGDREPETVSITSVGRAAHLAVEYFAPMALRAYGDASLPVAERHAAAIAKRIHREGVRMVNVRVIRREWALPGINKDSRKVNDALDVLVEAEWLKPTTFREGGMPGRLKENFSVNPKIWEASDEPMA